ncbi:MAG: HPr(Ser) kinase/phosphatase [Clostridia bacterium]|nr:HPr(Ser) kinase/phosphatase [Clostridia bacterium]
MKTGYKISLDKIIKEFSLEPLYMPESGDKLFVSSPEINRPGLQFAGYFEYFAPERIQILGISEIEFLRRFTEEKARERLEKFFSGSPSAVIIARDLQVEDYYKEIAQKHSVPLLRSNVTTSEFTAALIAFLNLHLAPRITRHGVFVEVYGEGILILGESGIGKSETAIELVKRGHRLIADDAVEIKKVSSKSLVGSAPENIKHFIELRGIGIINASRIFGIGAVKPTEKVDMVINLELWDVNKVYDRIGMENQTTEILGLDIPSMTIPVKPGRNLAVIIEVAAMNSRQKKLGYNAAQDLLKRLGIEDDITNQEG